MNTVIQSFAQELAEDLRKAGAPVSMEVALEAARVHVTAESQPKHRAMEVLVAAGVPMQMAVTGGFATATARIPLLQFSVNGYTIFLGW